MKNEIKCLFCEKDLSKEKFVVDYILVPVRDIPEDPSSLNKIAKPTHMKCLERFKELSSY